MRKVFLLVLLCLIPCLAFTQEIVLEGYYNGINLYVENPKLDSVNYCITNIEVNGKSIPPSQISSFDIEMSFLKKGIPVLVKIQHHLNCTPRVLNGNVIKKREPFRFVAMAVNKEELNWATRGEKFYGKYFIRRFDKNHWNTIFALDAKNDEGLQNYQYNVLHHSGDNTYQIKYLDSNGESFVSDTVYYKEAIPPVTFSPKKVKKELTFSRKIQYRIMDISGKVLQQGFSDIVDCKSLEDGIYYVAFENQVEQFFKK